MRVALITPDTEYALSAGVTLGWSRLTAEGDLHAAEQLMDRVTRARVVRTWSSGQVMVAYGDGTEALRRGRDVLDRWDDVIASVRACVDAGGRRRREPWEDAARDRLLTRLFWTEPLSARGLSLLHPQQEWVVGCVSAAMADEVVCAFAQARVTALERLVLGLTLDDLPAVCAQHMPALADRR